MAYVVAQAAPLLKAAGFRKRRYVFNRTTEPGLVQVVKFWMGPFQPPGLGSELHRAALESMGQRGDVYGTFRIDFGVYVPEMILFEHERCGSWVNEYNCQIRVGVGQLLPGGRKIWWSLDRADVAADLALDSLREVGLPWLDQLKTRDGILSAYAAVGDVGLGMTRGDVEIALLLRDREAGRAEALFRAELEKELPPSYRENLEAVLRESGFGHLVVCAEPST